MKSSESHLAAFINNTLASENLIISIPDPFDDTYRLSIQLNKRENTEVKINLTSGTSIIDVSLSLFANILTNHSMTNYHDHPENVQKLENHVADALEQRMIEFIERTQKEFKGNPFGWSLTVRKQFLTNKQFEGFDWMNQYPDMKVNLNLDIKNESLGRQSLVPELNQQKSNYE